MHTQEKKPVDNVLYKVSAPRVDWTFVPSRFWRTEDWLGSDNHPHAGFVEDWVLYAAEFDAVNIHLFPQVWRLRVWLDHAPRAASLRRLGYTWQPTARAVIFARHMDRARIEAFVPTIYTFDPTGFEQTPSNEFVARTPQTALAAETFPFAEAIQRWHVAVIYIADTDALAQSLRANRIDHQIQAETA